MENSPRILLFFLSVLCFFLNELIRLYHKKIKGLEYPKKVKKKEKDKRDSFNSRGIFCNTLFIFRHKLSKKKKKMYNTIFV